MAKFTSFTHIAAFISLFVFGQCQFPSSLMSMMGGGGGMSGMSGMGSGMMGMGGGMMNPMMSGMGMGMGGMMPGMMMGRRNDPMMALVMSAIELGPTDFMLLNQLVRTIVGPQASANAAMMVLYNTDGGLPINAIRMIPYVTLMQGMAKDLKIRVPGVRGEATNEQIDQYIFQRSLMWMQQRNMAGAFMELPGMGMMFMNNAMNGMNGMNRMQSVTPAPTTPKPSASQSNANAASAARAALAKFVAASKAAAAKKKAADAAAATPAKTTGTVAANQVTKPAAKATTTAPKFDTALFAKFMAAAAAGAASANGASSDTPNTPPTGMIGIAFPGGMSGNSGMGGNGGNGGMGGNGGGSMNPAFMAMGGMEMMGF